MIQIINRQKILVDRVDLYYDSNKILGEFNLEMLRHIMKSFQRHEENNDLVLLDTNIANKNIELSGNMMPTAIFEDEDMTKSITKFFGNLKYTVYNPLTMGNILRYSTIHIVGGEFNNKKMDSDMTLTLEELMTMLRMTRELDNYYKTLNGAQITLCEFIITDSDSRHQREGLTLNLTKLGMGVQKIGFNYEYVINTFKEQI